MGPPLQEEGRRLLIRRAQRPGRFRAAQCAAPTEGKGRGNDVGKALGPPAGGVQTKKPPLSAPFGGTFPLKGGRLEGKRPLIRLAYGQPPSPFRGEGYFTPGALAEKTQAQQLNRTRCRFCQRSPQWSGRDGTQALLILRAGTSAELFRRGPRKWGS